MKVRSLRSLEELGEKKLNNQESLTARSRESEVAPEGVRVLRLLMLAPKSVYEISFQTGIPLEECHRIIDRLLEVGLIIEQRDSDLYGHQTTRFRRHSVVISS